MIYRVRHKTHYSYNNVVSLCYNLAHMIPRSTPQQVRLRNSIAIVPQPVYARQYLDYFGNHNYHFSIDGAHDKLSVDVVSDIEIVPSACSLDLDLGNACEWVLQQLRGSTEHEVMLAREYVLGSPMVKPSTALAAYAAPSFDDARPLLSAVRELTQRIFEDFTFDSGFTTVATPLHQVLEHRRGVCQDFAHLAIGCLRSLGYPARYISGYLETLPPPGEEKLVGTDASHAWFAVYCPGEGWYEFDPTNNQMAAEQHIVCAWGRDYSDVPPLSGVVFGGGDEQALTVAVDVGRLSN